VAEVPGEYRNALRRMIVTQGDTEPASVEQQRFLGATAPSLYDLRNLFQVNVEEGRHLWAMVYLLHAHFGRDGREEADELLARRAGDADKPRILDAFNQPSEDWLTFFCFTTFTDRDGKYQLGALAESAFDPLSRTCRSCSPRRPTTCSSGETGVERVLRRACELAKVDPDGDVRRQGGIDFDTVQKFVNYWFSYSLDLFGSEVSSNAADFFASGMKGRWKEDKYEDHVCLSASRNVPHVENGKVVDREIPLRNAMNEVLRGEYVTDCEGVIEKWNKALEEEGVAFRVALPSSRFHRRQGLYAEHHFDPAGNPISAEQFEANRDRWLPSAADRAYVASLMHPVYEPGKMANWIAAPRGAGRALHRHGVGDGREPGPRAQAQPRGHTATGRTANRRAHHRPVRRCLARRTRDPSRRRQPGAHRARRRVAAEPDADHDRSRQVGRLRRGALGGQRPGGRLSPDRRQGCVHGSGARRREAPEPAFGRIHPGRVPLRDLDGRAPLRHGQPRGDHRALAEGRLPVPQRDRGELPARSRAHLAPLDGDGAGASLPLRAAAQSRARRVARVLWPVDWRG
jgi:benzoyl-CoA 2,3-dioxygenase component B